MSDKRYTEGFKVDAVHPVTERGQPKGDVAKLGATPYSLQVWEARSGNQSRQWEKAKTIGDEDALKALQREWDRRLASLNEPGAADRMRRAATAPLDIEGRFRVGDSY